MLLLIQLLVRRRLERKSQGEEFLREMHKNPAKFGQTWNKAAFRGETDACIVFRQVAFIPEPVANCQRIYANRSV